MNNFFRRNIYDPKSNSPFRISRSKIDLFTECPKCFYLDRRLGISRPSIPAFTLNSAVDTLLKKEFDLLRKKGEAHELMKKYKIDAIPFNHPDIDIWRNNFKGKEYHHRQTNFVATGAIDDVWINKKEEIIIVDYKATSQDKEISLDDQYKQAFKRQMEIYQWIFQKSGFKVAETGYFVYANAAKNRPKFDGVLEFELTLIPYKGNGTWIEPTLFKIKKVLDSSIVPTQGERCQYCTYRENAANTNNLKLNF